MIEEEDLREANGLVAAMHATLNGVPRYSFEKRVEMYMRLVELGIHAHYPSIIPDPRLPPSSPSAAVA